MAHEETGFGIEADKVIKNVFGSRGVYEANKDMKTIGVLEVDEEKKTKKIAIPVGIVAGLIPSTIPTGIAIFLVFFSSSTSSTPIVFMSLIAS